MPQIQVIEAPTHRVDEPSQKSNRGTLLRWLLGLSVLILLAILAWRVISDRPYTSASDVGYSLGVTGGIMMLVLLLYPLRKRAKSVGRVGPLRHWFRLHMYLGILGPLFIVFHSTFRLGSINATVAFACMLLVAGSGVVGRFLYGRVHRGLYGSRATLDELREELQRKLIAVDEQLSWLPELQRVLGDFSAAAATVPEGWPDRIVHFFTLGRRQRRAVRVARHAIEALTFREPEPAAGRRGPSVAVLNDLLENVEGIFETMQRAAQFDTYEHLFALWHVLHVPFVYLFVVTALAHVAAVHIY